MSIIKEKKILIKLLSLAIFSFFIFPFFAKAWNGLVPCDGVDTKCNFNQLVSMINLIIDWIISMSTIFFTLLCVYGGFLYMTSGPNPGNKQKAKKLLYSSLTGFIIILISYVIVVTILKALVPDDSYIFRFLQNNN